ncbi:MAG: LysM peptidoglycan-binding domain-containing protein [Chloroflexi bacterium]|nr:LysM peptidoglycan-binding domain-containing protein [Chloroflexota bacterium]
MKNSNRLTLPYVSIAVIVVAFALALIPITVMAAPPQQGPGAYFVQPGDTLFSIAMRYGTNVPTLMSANGLVSEYIYAGQRLVIPAGYNPYGYNWYYRGYYPYYWGYSSIYAPQPLPTVQLIPNPTFGCTYTVQPKDTVFSIAYRYQVSVPALMQANGLFSPIIHVGNPFKVPCLQNPPAPVTMYTVQPGDNLLRIAIKNNTTIYALSLVNGIYNPNFIYSGQVIAIAYPNSYMWTRTPAPLTPLPPTTFTPTPTPTNTPTPTQQANAVVVMTSKSFIPGTITINRGGTVLWQNNENFTHTVTSGVPGALDNKFRSGQLGNGQSFSFTFNITGTFPYFSETDQNMTGTVIVQ